MKRDHILGFPALAESAEHASAREPKYGLGIPSRRFDEIRALCDKRMSAAKAVVAFEQGDHTPAQMRTDTAWMEWAGGECPINGLVLVRLRCGLVSDEPCLAEHLYWGHFTDGGGAGGEIVAYRVAQ